MKKVEKQYRVVHSRSQKIWGIVALFGLFACGLLVGWGINEKRSVPKQLEMEQVANPAPQVKGDVAQPAQQNMEPKETCQIIEDLLLEQLGPTDSQEVATHEYNITIYEKLVMNGCSENQMKYHKAAQREREIVNALQQTTNSQQTCEQIESLLTQQLPPADGYSDSRIMRAKIYANLSERGCSENSQKYVDLAKQELDIARALEDDKFSNDETIEVVETYKRLNMQATAEEIFETAKKLTNPAIDFIIEVEKIINE